MTKLHKHAESPSCCQDYLRGPGRDGLLHALTQAISEEDLQISAARITTEKGAALDTFTLEEREGNPVVDADRIARLLLRLKRVVSR